MTIFTILQRIFGQTDMGDGMTSVDAPPPLSERARFDLSDPRIPANAKSRIAGVARSVSEIFESSHDRFADLRMEAERLMEHHLPQLVESYIAIPPSHRTEIFRSTGKSASIILCENLDRMQRGADEMLKRIAQADIDAFTVNARFVEERYSPDIDPFRLG